MRVYFHSRYDGNDLTGTHMDIANKVFQDFFDFVPLQDAEFCLLLDLEKAQLRGIKRSIPDARNRFLIVREPRQVHPFAHTRVIQKLFGHIFRLGTYNYGSDDLTPWPYTSTQSAPIQVPGQRRRLQAVAAIAAWRVSFIRGALYDLRAEAFSGLDVDTFGRGWDAPLASKFKEVLAQLFNGLRWPQQLSLGSGKQIFSRPRNFLGEAADKKEILGTYKASLVIENSRDYMSEKVLDALTAGSIPVYVGPDLSPFGIPDSLVVICEPNMESLSLGIDYALGMDYDAWRVELDSWLRSDMGNRCVSEELLWRELCLEIRGKMEKGKRIS